MTALDPEITITGLRGRVAELIDTRDRLTSERDDASDEVVKLCQERLQLRQALAAATAERDQARAALDRVRALHARKEHPIYGCCCSPKVCTKPHPAVCNSPSHGLNRPAWPCDEIRAIDGDGT